MEAEELEQQGAGGEGGESGTQPSRDDAALLKEIRDNYSYFRQYWQENYDEAQTDLRFVAGDPWDPSERQAREDNKRPVLCPDELEQYLNATINNLRQNPLGVKVEPKGEGASEENAARRQAIIRNIEYDSVAQSAYENAYSCAIECAFGFFRVTTKRVKRGSDEVEPRVRIIDNPLSVLMDPNAKEADYCDMKRCFAFDVMRKEDFQRAYPRAKKQSFSAEDMKTAPDWLQADNVTVAEYWRIEGYDEDGEGGTVTQYVTNGVEILSETPWPGSRIPIIPVLGKVRYVPRGGRMTRMYYSMIRKARGPQMMMAYIASQEAEEFGMAPRAPFVGVVGQFETDKDSWETLNKVPRAYVQYDQVVDQTSATGALCPPPTRPQFQPNAQAYEMSKESWRRSIQAAMGITPLPTAAQRQNEKSGVALERIETQQSVGAYHFTANFKRSLQNAGFQLNELITKILDTPRQIAGRGQDDEQSVLHVAPGGAGAEKLPQGAEVFDPQAGEFDVTISSGPSFQSQREAASNFADLLVQQIDALPVAPESKAKLLALSVKLKNIGPLGDEMAEILDPQAQAQIPPAAQAQIAQLQQHLQVAQQLGMELHQKVQELEFEKKAGIVKNQGDMALEKLKIEADVAKAEVTTKSQMLAERVEFIHDLLLKLVDQKHAGHEQGAKLAHEVAMAGVQHEQAKELATQQAAHASLQSAQDATQTSAQSAQDAVQQQAAVAAQPAEATE